MRKCISQTGENIKEETNKIGTTQHHTSYISNRCEINVVSFSSQLTLSHPIWILIQDGTVWIKSGSTDISGLESMLKRRTHSLSLATLTFTTLQRKSSIIKNFCFHDEHQIRQNVRIYETHARKHTHTQSSLNIKRDSDCHTDHMDTRRVTPVIKFFLWTH